MSVLYYRLMVLIAISLLLSGLNVLRGLREAQSPSIGQFEPRTLPVTPVSSASNPSYLKKVYWVDQNDQNASDQNPGTSTLPWKTISRAFFNDTIRPGDTLLIRAGVYREQIMPPYGGAGPDSRITIRGFADESVIISGADILDPGAWEKRGQYWVMEGYNTLPAYGDREFRRELIIIGDSTYKPVYSKDELAPGSFFVQDDNARNSSIYLSLDPGTTPSLNGVQLAKRHPLFEPLNPDFPYLKCGDPDTPGWFNLLRLTFRHASNRAQWGSICLGSEGTLLEEVIVEWTNGLGINASGTNHIIRKTISRHNGQSGIGGSCENCLIEDVVSAYNNWKGFNPFWEAGGGKWSHTNQTIFRRYSAHDNSGPGLWLDGDNHDNLIENSSFDNNIVAGIFLELNTTNTIIRYSFVTRTKRQSWSGAGILIQASSFNQILDNVIEDNDGAGIWLRGDDRDTDGNNLIQNNVIAGNALDPGNDRSEIAIMSDLFEEAVSNRLNGNTYWHESSDPTSTIFIFRTSDTNVYYTGSNLSEWRAIVGGADQSIIVQTRPH
jgi:parallel beta-helix repeat protein